jgi:hypothetical protein
MKTYRLKPPTFEARQFDGRVHLLINGFFGWLGSGARVLAADSEVVRIEIAQGMNRIELRNGDWVVRHLNGNPQDMVVSDEDFKRDFEVAE